MSTIEAQHLLGEVFKKHNITEVYVHKGWCITDAHTKFYVRYRGLINTPRCIDDLAKIVKLPKLALVMSYDSPLLLDTILIWTEAGWRV